MSTQELKEALQEELSKGVEVVAIQPTAIVDHVISIDADTLKHVITDELGGSHRVSLEEVRQILSAAGEYYSKAGGSSANTTRGLAGFGINVRLVGARGSDEQGALFNSSMKRAGVDVSRVSVKEGSTGRSCILSCQGQRTMRTWLEGAARLSKEELTIEDFAGVKYAFLSGYACYSEGLLERAMDLALASGCKVALDLASFEVIRAFRNQLSDIIEAGGVSLCFCNEDEAVEIAGGKLGPGPSPEAGLEYLSQHCAITVVTLGEKGCLVKERGSQTVIAQPAASGVVVVDTTGAGDLFAAGFLYSLLREFPLKRSAEIGCLAGGAVVQALGAEMGPAGWQWLSQRLHGELAAEAVRNSATAVQRELLECYSLIEQKGRGVVYYGSARLREGSPHWTAARELGAAVARLLNVTTWSGGGPGMMHAATLGAMDAQGGVAGIRIGREAGTTVRSASYLPADAAVVCRFLSSRKVALTDCGVRAKETEKTAFIFLPGGLGTMDEFFELLTLVQLRKLGTEYPVPVILCNYEVPGARGRGFYDGLLAFLALCNAQAVVGSPELHEVLVASDNQGVLQALAKFYDLPWDGSNDKGRNGVVRASEWVEARSPRIGAMSPDL